RSSDLGTYTWTLTVTSGSVTCSKQGQITIAGSCTLGCSATVPASGSTATPTAFTASATPSGSCSTVSYGWSFGDASANTTVQNPQHLYQNAGTYTWTLTVTSGSVTCTKQGQIVINAPPPTGTLGCSATVPTSAERRAWTASSTTSASCRTVP